MAQAKHLSTLLKEFCLWPCGARDMVSSRLDQSRQTRPIVRKSAQVTTAPHIRSFPSSGAPTYFGSNARCLRNCWIARAVWLKMFEVSARGGGNMRRILSQGVPAPWRDRPDDGRESRTLVLMDCASKSRMSARSIATRRTDRMCCDWIAGGMEPLRDLLPPLAAVLLNIGGRSFNDPSVADEVREFTSEFGCHASHSNGRFGRTCVKYFQALDCGVKRLHPVDAGNSRLYRGY